jgi:hypothetical protein
LAALVHRTGVPMPRYYIDVRSRFGLDADVAGVDLPDLDAARHEGLKVALRLRERWVEIPPAERHFIAVEIVDECLRPILAFPVSEVGV